MGKSEEKSGDFEGFRAGKTANGLEFTGGRQKGMPGIYAVGSRRLGLIGIWASRSVRARVRRFQSDYRNGKVGIVDKMGLRLQPDVTFQVLEECGLDIAEVRIQYWVKEARSRGYKLWNFPGDYGSVAGSGEEAMQKQSVGKVLQIMERWKIGDEAMLRMLEALELGIETRSGADARLAGGD